MTPQTVEVGGTATATPHATDAASGVASESCDVPADGDGGRGIRPCRATDVAGNTATAFGYYTVVANGHARPRPRPRPHPDPTPHP